MTLDPRLVTDKERSLFKIGVVFSALCWLLLLVSLIGAVYGLFGLAFFLMAHALYLAHVRGNGVRLSATQLPDLHARCVEAAKKLGMTEIPEVYLVQSGGILNAFATKLLSRKFVVIYSSLVSACNDPRELDFVIGHELGHLAAGHLAWNGFLLPFHLCPWLGPAYSRAREYTCDRCGLSVVGDLEPSARALVVLAAGGKMAAQVDLSTFAEQRRESGQFWMATLELNASHPFLCKRVAALQDFRQPGSVPSVARTAWAYPLAPLFAIFSGGASGAATALLVMVAMIGLLAALAIPAFTKYTERARAVGDANALQQQLLQQKLDQADDDEGDPPQDENDAPAPAPAPAPRPAAPVSKHKPR